MLVIGPRQRYCQWCAHTISVSLIGAFAKDIISDPLRPKRLAAWNRYLALEKEMRRLQTRTMDRLNVAEHRDCVREMFQLSEAIKQSLKSIELREAENA